MRKVSRKSTPKTLIRHADRWKQELLAEIARRGTYAKVSRKFKKKYNQLEVRATLEYTMLLEELLHVYEPHLHLPDV